jgi:ATP-dependent DNA helicase DinG
MLDPAVEPPGKAIFLHASCGQEEEGGNRVYSLAAAAVSPEGEVERFASLVRYRKTTAREHYHSGVSRKDLAAAPEPAAVAEEIKSFLQGRGVVAAFSSHSDFDELRHFCGEVRIIDLNFAAEFFLPFLPSSHPRNLWEHLYGKKRDRLSIESEEMVGLSIELTKHICGVLLNDVAEPRAAALRHYLEESHTLFGAFFTHLNRHFRRYFGGLFDARKGDDRADWTSFLERAGEGPGPSSEPGEKTPIDCERLDEAWQGLSATPDFRLRPSQAEYARHVAAALNEGEYLTIEAGTGTGKTLGYLLPLMEFLRRNEATQVAVSTYTKSLQDQVFQREIVALQKNLKVYRDIPVALLKGKSSYACAEKLDDALDSGTVGAHLLAWLYLANLIYHHRRVDLGGVGRRIVASLDDDGFFSRLRSEVSARNGCFRRHRRCPAQVMAAEARAARLVVTNHHKLSLLESDPVLEGLFKHCLIDEANHFESAVRSAFAVEISSREIADDLHLLRTTMGRMRRRVQGLKREGVEKVLEAAARASETLPVVASLLQHRSSARGEVETIIPPSKEEAEGPLADQISTLSSSLEKIGAELETVDEESGQLELQVGRRTISRTARTAAKLSEKAAAIRALAAGLGDEGSLVTFRCWVKHWLLRQCVVDVSALVRERVLQGKEAVIFTSATLCRKGSFDIFRGIVGLGPHGRGEDECVERECRFEILESPLSRESMEIVVPSSAPSGDFRNKAVWIDYVVETLPLLVKENRGRTLVLFASYEDLDAVARMTSSPIAAEGHPVLVQRKGQPTTDLCDEFRSLKESVLFGVDSFWYGIDFRGDTLTQVIITRVPYPSRRSPLQVSREVTMERSEYWRRYYYDTDIRMRQGMGRLIRGEKDRGRVVFLDSRAARFLQEGGGE